MTPLSGLELSSLEIFWRIYSISLLPIIEWRGSIPFGLISWPESWQVILLGAILGSFTPFLPLYFGFNKLRALALLAHPILLIKFDQWIAKKQLVVEKHYNAYGYLGLAIFVFIPLPLTGIWSAALVASALKLPWKGSALSALIGLSLSASLIVAIGLGIIAL